MDTTSPGDRFGMKQYIDMNHMNQYSSDLELHVSLEASGDLVATAACGAERPPRIRFRLRATIYLSVP